MLLKRDPWLEENHYPELSKYKLSVYSSIWRDKCHQQVYSVVQEYNNVLGIRIDLNYPDKQDSVGIDNSNDDIVLFIKSMESKVKRCIGYVIFREFSEYSGKKHYHIVLYFKGVRGIGVYYSEAGIQKEIIESWLAVGGGSVHFGECIRFNEKTKENQIEIANQCWFDYMCKVKSKVSDGYKNVLFSSFDKSIVIPKEEKVRGDKHRVHYYRQAFEEGLDHYQSTLLCQMTFYHPEEKISKSWMKAYGRALYSTLLDEKKGGLAYIGGSVQRREDNYGWMDTQYRITLMLAGARYRTPCYSFKEALLSLGERLLPGIVIQMGLHHWVKHKSLLENKTIKKGLEKFYLMPLLYDKVGNAIKEGLFALTGLRRQKNN